MSPLSPDNWAFVIVIGLVLMLLQFGASPGFFKRKLQVASPDAPDPPASEGAAS